MPYLVSPYGHRNACKYTEAGLQHACCRFSLSLKKIWESWTDKKHTRMNCVTVIYMSVLLVSCFCCSFCPMDGWYQSMPQRSKNWEVWFYRGNNTHCFTPVGHILSPRVTGMPTFLGTRREWSRSPPRSWLHGHHHQSGSFLKDLGLKKKKIWGS